MKRARGKESCQEQTRDVQTDWISRGFNMVYELPYYKLYQGAEEGVVPPASAVDNHGNEILPLSPASAPSKGYVLKHGIMRACCKMCPRSFLVRSHIGGPISWKGAKSHLRVVHRVTGAASMEVAL